MGGFANPPGDYCLELMSEFHQNLNLATNTFIVGVHLVYFSPQAINGLHSLTEVDDEETRFFLDNQNWEVVEAELRPRGANSTYNHYKKYVIRRHYINVAISHINVIKLLTDIYFTFILNVVKFQCRYFCDI